MLSIRPKIDLTQLVNMVEGEPMHYGWLPDPLDERDEDYEFCTTQAYRNYSSNISSIDNTKFFKEVSNQLHLPSCTANAGCDLLEAVEIHDCCKNLLDMGHKVEKALEASHKGTPDFSRLFAWWNGRNALDPPQHKNIKSGCYNRLIMDSFARFGVPREQIWPYNEDVLPPLYEKRPIVRPSVSAYREARGHMVNSYHALLGRGDERIEQVIKALQGTPGVLFGTIIGKGFGHVGADVAYTPTTKLGGHAMVIVGYNKAKQAFLARNSWSKRFGVNGYFWMHESYLAWTGTRGLWVITKGVLV